MALLIIPGCQKHIIEPVTEPNTGRDTASNHPPIASAGADKYLYLPDNTIALDASASRDPDNDIISFIWKYISGPASYTIMDSSAKQTSVTNLIAGEYDFGITITDTKGAIGKDTCHISVLTPPLLGLSVSVSPIYSLLNLATNSEVLSAGAYLTNNTIPNLVNKQWRKISGPGNYLINSPSAMETLVSGLTSGVYQFEFKASDVNGLVDSAQTTVSVVDLSTPNQDTIITNQSWTVDVTGFGCNYIQLNLDQYIPAGTPVKKVPIKPDCVGSWTEVFVTSVNTNNDDYSYLIFNAHYLEVYWCQGGCNTIDTPDIKIVY